MTRSRKLETYKQQMVAQGVSEATAFPPLWRVLWSGGIKVAPPPFLSFFSLTALTGSFFGPFFAVGAWVLRPLPAEEALWVALITGLAFGLAMATYYRHLARKHRLGSWAAFSSPWLRT